MIARDRWIRWDRVKRNGKLEKVPFTTVGSYASSTNANTWSTFTEASASAVGVGLGYVLGDGIGCIDLDHCLSSGNPNKAAAKFLQDYPHHFIEVSPSGEGLHIWGQQKEQGGRRQTIGGLSIEHYSVGRYMTITGNVYQNGELLPL